MPIIGDGGGASSSVRTATTRLASADILALNTTPVTLVAGVAGSVIVPVSLVPAVLTGANAYTGAYIVRVFIGPTWAGAGWGSQLENTNVFNVNPAAAFLSEIINKLAADTEALTLLNGQPLRLDTDNAVAAGNGSAVVTVMYSLAPLT